MMLYLSEYIWRYRDSLSNVLNQGGDIMKLRRLRGWGLAFGMVFAILFAGEGYFSDSGIVRKVPTTHKVVALTFDDGPHADSTPKLLSVLRQKEVKATMFVLGENVEKHPELLQQMVADGHEIGSHAYSHVFISKISPEERAEQLAKAERVITIAAPKPVLFRPPGGGYSDEIVKEISQRGYRTILWSVDPRDWSRPGVNRIVNTVLAQVKPGSIVLLHDGQYDLQTAAAVSIIIDRLRADGYSLVTVGELLQYYEERHITSKILDSIRL